MGNKHSFDVYQLTTSYEVVKNEMSHGKSHTGKQLSERAKIAINDYTQNESNEFAYLSRSDFQTIFGKRNADYGSKQVVLKITNAQTGKSIHRLYRTSHNIHGLKDYIVLTYSSLLKLSNSQDSFNRMDKLVVSKGCIFWFYMYHPNHCTKITIWMAAVSIIVSLISIVIALL